LRTSLLVLISGLIGLCLYFAIEQTSLGAKKMTAQTTLTFPKDSIEFLQGDYLISQTEDGRWKVFKVNELVLLSRLVPLKFKHGIELIEEKHTLNSVKPAYWGEIHLLLTVYKIEFSSSDEAIESIKNKKLDSGKSNLCMSIRTFKKESFLVYRSEK
jgi:hypothetical protein